MKPLLAAVAALALALSPGRARAAHAGGGHFGGGHFGGGRVGGHGFHGSFHRGFHGGFHGGFPGHRGFGPRIFIGGAFWDPWWYYPGPYYAPYPYPYPYAYPAPPPEDSGWGPPPDEQTSAGTEDEGGEPSEEEVSRATYGLVQLRGIPDGAAVDLDGRFWMTAKRLDDRWLALPEGNHRIVVRVEGSEAVERSFSVATGKSHTIRFGPFPRSKS